MRGGQITELVGVYDADGTVLGELSYFVGKRLGRAHCALCDITHGLVRERDDWRAARDRLLVPFVTFHRDDQPDAVRVAAGGVVPIVVAELTSGVVVPLVGPDALDACAGSPIRLVEAVRTAATTHGLTWPDEHEVARDRL